MTLSSVERFDLMLIDDAARSSDPKGWEQLQRSRTIDRPWPAPPELAYRTYRITSSHWSGEIKVRRILLDNFGEARAVPFTVWGYLLKTFGEQWEPLFARFGRHEVRKRFIESVRFELMAKN